MAQHLVPATAWQAGEVASSRASLPSAWHHPGVPGYCMSAAS
jgi:hypothetical protein